VADDVSQLGVVHDPEDRGAAGRVDPVDAERAALDDQHVRGDQRRSLAANYNVNSAILQTSNLARPLTPGLAFQTVDLTLPGDVYPDRVNSVDLRVAKVLRFGARQPTSASTSTTC
jgi:hypothetical protein